MSKLNKAKKFWSHKKKKKKTSPDGEALASLQFEFHLQLPCGSPSTELSVFRQSAQSGNESECKHVPRVMKSLLMSSPPISISHRLFQFPETCWLHTRSEVHCTHLIQVHLEILSRPVESMASHLLTKYIT